jgi:hypothetical protein
MSGEMIAMPAKTITIRTNEENRRSWTNLIVISTRKPVRL